MLSRLFSNYLKIIKIQRSQIAKYVEFHIENITICYHLKIIKIKTGLCSIFFHLKIDQLYIIMYFYVI